MQHGETIRAPGEAPGLLAFESAMDELAAALAVDPVELRLRNKPELDPELQIPLSSRRLVTCLREGHNVLAGTGGPGLQPRDARAGS